jgi:hypothetical protein
VFCFLGCAAGPADNPGINSRALAELFKLAQERSAEVAYSLSASVLEIYQEQIFDLLTGSKDTGKSVRQPLTACMYPGRPYGSTTNHQRMGRECRRAFAYSVLAC